MRRGMNFYLVGIATSFASIALSYAAAPPADANHARWGAIEQYCVDCHNITDWAGGVAFDSMSPDKLSDDAKVWESAVRKLRGGFMPPPGAKKRPDSQTVKGLVNWLETSLDAAQVQPPPGRVPMRRLNRREYANSIRDLLGLDINVASLLPTDERKDGFDNNASNLQISPSFLDQYLNAARTVALQAVGNPKALAVTVTYGPINDMEISLPPRGTPGEGNQGLYKDGMPFGTRGGMTAEHLFPADGEYALSIGDMALGRDVPKMEFDNTVIALLDGKEIYRTNIGGDEDQKSIDLYQQPSVQSINSRLKNIKFYATAGQHHIAVTFLKRSYAESDERFKANSLEGGQDRVQAVHALQIRGPLSISGVSDSPSRAKIFVCHPTQAAEEAACARKILSNLAHRAFRRPVTDEDLHALVAFYENGKKEAGFDAGIRDAVSAVIASPYFLYRVEAAEDSADGRTLNDIELASRMSFFIWSSLPDDELLSLAERKELSKPEVLSQQVRRMVADPKAKSLTDDFAFQWLNVSRLDEIVPERGLFPFASGLLDPRPLFREELSLFIDSILRSDQPVTALLNADYTYLNESLAMLYGIENVKGGQFRRVQLQDTNRNGLLGKGGILMLTANPNRNSPVLRGAWILDRVLGTPPAAPPNNVSPLPDAGRGQRVLSMRERMAQHSTNPSCFACHGVMDPLGLPLENFNTVGQFHDKDPVTKVSIDTSGAMADGTKLKGPADLRAALLARSDQFVQAITERLMTYALGRGLEYYDMPTVRHIVREAPNDQYRFAAIVEGVVTSEAFRKRAPVESKPAESKKLQTASAEDSNISKPAAATPAIGSNTVSQIINSPSVIPARGN
jgi:mono/diheme cytochrome c family protein